MKKFHGKPNEFKEALDSLGQRGEWQKFESGLKFKSVDGGYVLWYPSTGTIQIQGNKEAKDRLTVLMRSLNHKDLQIEQHETEVVPEIRTAI